MAESSERAVPRDLVGLSLPELSWASPDDVERSLRTLRVSFEQRASQASAWYAANLRGKRVLAKLSRGLASLLGVAGMLVPVLLVVKPHFGFLRWLVPELGYVLFALSAALLLCNRVLGWSAGWMRYVRARSRIEHLREAFRLRWERAEAERAQAPLDLARASALLLLLQEFQAALGEILRIELEGWVAAFERDLLQLELFVRARGDSQPLPEPPKLRAGSAEPELHPTGSRVPS